MDSQNQFMYFAFSVLIGFIGAAMYEIIYLLRWIFGCRKGKNKAIGTGLDILFFIIFTIWCIFTSYLLHFPSFRVYIGIGYLVGGIIYLKILHKTVAIFEKVCYNMFTKMVEKVKKTRKNSLKEVNI